MSAADNRALMYSTIYDYEGLVATWGSQSTPVKVLRETPDVSVGVGQGFAIVGSVVLKVRSIEVSAPAEGDTVVIGDKTYELIAEPMIDAHGDIFTCEARKV